MHIYTRSNDFGVIVRIFFLVLLISSVHCTSAIAARWQHGGSNANFVESVDYGQTGNVVIGEGKNHVWYWGEASGIGFKEDTDELSAGQIAGGHCNWTIKFRFSKPISKFRFKTPLCTGVDLSGGDFYIEYTTSVNQEYKEIWRYSKNSSGYKKDDPILPHQIDWIEFASEVSVKEITLRFNIDGFINNMKFHEEKAGGVIEYTTKMGRIQEMVSIKLLPDASKVANTYYVDLPPRVIIDLGPVTEDITPSLHIYDIGRQLHTGTPSIYRLGQRKFCIDMPKLSAGVYELRLMIPNISEPIHKTQFALIHPARQLSWEQTISSPFGVIGITRTGPFREAPILNGPALGKMLGIHSIRGGLGSWAVVNEQQGSFKWNDSDLTNTENISLEYGLVFRAVLGWTPGWAVDMSRVKEGDWPGYYPPKPEFIEDFAEFCRQAAHKSQGVFRPEFEIWNEANNEPYGAWKGTFEEFVKLNHTAADAVLSVNPDARLILGTTGGTDAGYIARLFNSGLAKKFKIVDVHPYRHSDRGPEDGLLVDINRIKKVIELYGDNQSIIFTEIGWPTYTVGDHAGYAKVTRFQQACYFSRTLLISIAAGIERVHFHILSDFGKDPTQPEDNFGIVDISGQPKLSLSALSTTHRHLEQAEFKGVVNGLPEYHHMWAWDTPWIKDTLLLTIWCDTHNGELKPKWVDMPVKPIVTEDLWGGVVLKDRLRETPRGWQVLPGEDPLFVYIPSSKKLQLDKLPMAMRPRHLRRLTSTHYEEKSIVVDGNVSEWTSWPGTIDKQNVDSGKGMGYAGIEENVGQRKDSKDEFTKFSIGHNNDGLFVAAQVKDDTPMQNDFSNFYIWMGDHVRLYISTVDSLKHPYYSDNHFSPAFAPLTTGNGPAQAIHLGISSPLGLKQGDIIPGAKVAAQKVEEGWNLECMIPWEYFGKKPTHGDIWEFDIEAGGRIWNGSRNNWNNPLLWGKIEFSN